MEVKQAHAHARLHQQAVQTTVWLLEASLAEEANVLRRWFPSERELGTRSLNLQLVGFGAIWWWNVRAGASSLTLPSSSPPKRLCFWQTGWKTVIVSDL